MVGSRTARRLGGVCVRAILVGLAVCLLTGGIPKSTTIHKMYFDNRIVEGQESEVWLTDRTNRRPVWQEPDGPDWFASAPTIRAANGRYLAYDENGKNPVLFLSADKGPGAEWGFDIVGEVTPVKMKRQTEGFSGIKAKLQATSGPFKGWYVARGPETQIKTADGKEETRWSFQLTKKREEAIELTFLSKRIWVHHN